MSEQTLKIIISEAFNFLSNKHGVSVSEIEAAYLEGAEAVRAQADKLIAIGISIAVEV